MLQYVCRIGSYNFTEVNPIYMELLINFLVKIVIKEVDSIINGVGMFCKSAFEFKRINAYLKKFSRCSIAYINSHDFYKCRMVRG